ncbi:iron-sulfur cluster repair di-iron protein, ric [Ruoffia tabacinasalis]|uniref:Iron-sulfur cluster repair di-iron protein, ric n=1 Tax=Ruoffia tabacinasalis TaxID=87458 RepID=A0A5R9DVL5_9LACT|nr:iron-sulfur cluster repair di-iron protein, ric [Ruoffia tabacinasalis]MBG9978971.1 iron-sulfur cluster repair di-iron protein, ric [Ruoffia tabacinasalis]TLQ40122.1 iron-sulfur cluster repair di-iron protein, ric [Ruoffia tabacinasalis]
MTKFNDYINTNAEKLDLYTTAITRAHGKNHPEAFDVRDIYVRIQDKTQAAEEEQPDLNTEFTTLREISDNYTIPDDVCGTYAAVYTMLKEADSLYLS